MHSRNHLDAVVFHRYKSRLNHRPDRDVLILFHLLLIVPLGQLSDLLHLKMVVIQ